MARFIVYAPAFMTDTSNRSSDRTGSNHGSTVTRSRRKTERISYAFSSRMKTESLSPEPAQAQAAKHGSKYSFSL